MQFNVHKSLQYFIVKYYLLNYNSNGKFAFYVNLKLWKNAKPE